MPWRPVTALLSIFRGGEEDSVRADPVDQEAVSDLVRTLKRGVPKVRILTEEEAVPRKVLEQSLGSVLTRMLLSTYRRSVNYNNESIRQINDYIDRLRALSPIIVRIAQQAKMALRTQDEQKARIEELEAANDALVAEAKKRPADAAGREEEEALTEENGTLRRRVASLEAQLSGVERRQNLLSSPAPALVEQRTQPSFGAVAPAPDFWNEMDASKIKQTAYDNAGAFPRDKQDIADWARFYLSGRLVLTERAYKTIQASQFNDVVHMCCALLLLAHEYRDLAMATPAERVARLQAFSTKASAFGLMETPSASIDTRRSMPREYQVTHQARVFELDRHLKSGMGRSEEAIFRCYFTFDKETGRVVVGDMPKHLKNKKT